MTSGRKRKKPSRAQPTMAVLRGTKGEVKSGDPPGPKRGMTDAMVAARNMELVRRADQGMRPGTLAIEYGLHETHVHRIIREAHRSRRKLLDEADMLDHVNQTLAVFDQAIEDLQKIDIPADHPAAYIGAMRLKMDTVKARWELLQAIGHVPQTLSTIRVQLEAIDIANEVTAVLDAWEGHVVDDDLFDAMISALEGKGWRGPNGELPPGSPGGQAYEGTASDLDAAA